jgi:hypothetical protein
MIPSAAVLKLIDIALHQFQRGGNVGCPLALLEDQSGRQRAVFSGQGHRQVNHPFLGLRPQNG